MTQYASIRQAIDPAKEPGRLGEDHGESDPPSAVNEMRPVIYAGVARLLPRHYLHGDGKDDPCGIP